MTDKDAISLREYFVGEIKRLEKQHDDWVKYWYDERERGLERIKMQADALEKRLTERAESAQRAVDRADKDLDKRLHEINEFRAQIRDLINLMATKVELNLMSKDSNERLRKLEDWSSNLQGRIAAWLALGGGVVSLVSVLFNYAIRKAFE